MINFGGPYEGMGRVRDICLVPNVDTIYVLAKFPKPHEIVRCHLPKLKYDTYEGSTPWCDEITSKISNNIVSMFIYIYVLCIIVRITIFFINDLSLTWNSFVFFVFN